MSNRLNRLDLARLFWQRLIVPILGIILASGLIAAPAYATGVYDLPELSAGETTWVIDQADAISRVTEGTLSGALQKLAQETGNEVRMVAIRRLDYGETIDSFTEELFTNWFPTSQEQANQTLIAIDTLTNRVGLRRGEQLATPLNDEIVNSIKAESIGIPLRKGSKYNEAFLEASNRLVAILSGQPDPGPPIAQDTLNIESTYASAEETDDRSATVWVIVLLLLATVIPMVTYFWYVGFPG